MRATDWHKKPAGTKGPCPICGCPAKRMKAWHRVVLAYGRSVAADGEIRNPGQPVYEKKESVGFGHDVAYPVAVGTDRKFVPVRNYTDMVDVIWIG